MKEGWTYKKLVEICDISAGQGAPQGEENYCDNGIPFVKAGNLEELVNGLDENCIQKVNEEVARTHKLKLYKAGSVVFAKSGMSCMKGFVYTLKHDCYVVSHLAILTPKGVSSSFLNYSLNYYKPNTLVKDEAYPSISLGDISELTIPVPPIEIQSHIVAEFDLLRSIIDKQQSQLKELDNLAQTIFYDMFGDPITNEKGWETKKYGEEFTIGAGGTPSKNCPDYWEGGTIPWIGSNMCQNQIIYKTDGKFITKEGLSHSSAKMLEVDTVLVALVGATIGKVALLKTETCTNQNVAFIKVQDNPSYNSYFVYYQLQSLYDLFMAIGNGDFRMANQGFIKELPIIRPPLLLQQSFADKIESIEKQKAAINQSIMETQKLFDYTMDKYFG